MVPQCSVYMCFIFSHAEFSALWDTSKNILTQSTVYAYVYIHMYVHTHFHVYNIFSDIYIQNMSKIIQTDPCPSPDGSLPLKCADCLYDIISILSVQLYFTRTMWCNGCHSNNIVKLVWCNRKMLRWFRNALLVMNKYGYEASRLFLHMLGLEWTNPRGSGPDTQAMAGPMV